MNILGLTGSIGMGKSCTSEMFQTLGVPIFDADRTVHNFLDGGAAAKEIFETMKISPTNDGKIDRIALGNHVFDNPKELAKLEAILHPLVQEAKEDFLTHHKDENLVVLDIPLLFETGSNKYCTHVAVTAPADIQKERVLARPNMTVDKFEAILEAQTPNDIKCDQADFIIYTDKGLDHALTEVKKIVTILS